MKTVQVKLYKAVMLVVLAAGLPAFIAGWVVAVNFSGVFETGYKMAFIDIKTAINKSVHDGQQYFNMNGITFYPEKITERADFPGIKVATENQDAEEGKRDGGNSDYHGYFQSEDTACRGR